MSKSKISQQRRKAIYDAYSNKCFYCGKHIEWDELEIDHLIAEKTPNLKEVLLDYGLPDNYDLNDLTNLVPSHSFCNNRKTNTPFHKATYLYYRSLTDKHITTIQRIEAGIVQGYKKDKLLTKIDVAIENKDLSLLELQDHIIQLLEENWKEQFIHLPTPITFVGQTIEKLPILGDYRNLLNTHLDINNSDCAITLANDDNKELVKIHTLNEWRAYTAEGFYPLSNSDIRLSGYFHYLDTLLITLENIKRPKYSPIEDFKLSDIYKLSSTILIDPYDSLESYGDCSIGWLADQNLAEVEVVSDNMIRIKHEGFEHYFIEQFRGDANGDDIEDIFVLCNFNAIGGTMGWTCTNLFGRNTKNELVHIVTNPWTPKI